MKKGLALLFVVSTFLVAMCFAPSIHAEESKAYSRYKLVDSWIDGGYRTCLYKNIRGETKSTSINKGKRCPSVY